jgi:site-specific DNA recombinase
MNTAILLSGLYARVSSEAQARERTIESQLEDLLARARADGMPPPPELIFIDDGYSGSSLIRPGLERLRDIAAAGGIDRLYIHCPDRLARDFAHQLVLIDEFHRAGVEIVFLNYNVDDSPEGHLLLQIQGVIAQYERAKILERSRRGRQHAARSGAISALSGAPYGYRYITKSEGEGRADYRVVLEEARVVRQIFEWVGRERCSLREVARRLKKQGTITRTGKLLWEPATLVGMLKNPAYKGMAALDKTRGVDRRPRLRPRRGQSEFPRRNSCARDTAPEEQIPIPVPAIVDEEIFAAAQEQLAHNRKHHGRRPHPGRYLLQGLVVCAQCGRAYYGACSGRATESSKRAEPARSYGYYRCCGTDRARFGGSPVCSNRTVRTDRLDAAVWADVRGLLLEPGRIEAEYRRRQERPAAPEDQNRQAIDAQLRGLKRRIARLTEMYEEGFLERDAFRDRMAAARSRLESLEADALAAAEQEASESELRLVIGQLQAFSEQLRSGLEDTTPETRQEIVRALVKRVEIEEHNVRIVYKVSPVPFDDPPPGGGVLGRGNTVSGNCVRRVAPAVTSRTKTQKIRQQALQSRCNRPRPDSSNSSREIFQKKSKVLCSVYASM